MGERVFKIRELSLPYVIIINKRLKGFKIVLDSKGIKLNIPEFTRRVNPEAILKSKEDWIYKSYKKLSMNKVVEKAPKLWITGEKLLFQGEFLPITANNQFQPFEQQYNIIRTTVRYNQSTIKILAAENNKKLISINFNEEGFFIYQYVNLLESTRTNLIEDAFRLWFIERARSCIKKSLDYYKNKMYVDFQQFRIKEQKTRWGSCSGKKNLNFNWKLILAPMETLDYVVVHELAHLKEMNHSKNFWSEVSKWMPDYQQHIDYLKKNIDYLNNWDKNTY